MHLTIIINIIFHLLAVVVVTSWSELSFRIIILLILHLTTIAVPISILSIIIITRLPKFLINSPNALLANSIYFPLPSQRP